MFKNTHTYRHIQGILFEVSKGWENKSKLKSMTHLIYHNDTSKRQKEAPTKVNLLYMLVPKNGDHKMLTERTAWCLCALYPPPPPHDCVSSHSSEGSGKISGTQKKQGHQDTC